MPDETRPEETKAAPGHAPAVPAGTAYTQADAASRADADAAVSPDWQVGDVLLNIYEVTGVLGEGGMGRVYKVHHNGWNTDLAVKSPRASRRRRSRNS